MHRTHSWCARSTVTILFLGLLAGCAAPTRAPVPTLPSETLELPAPTATDTPLPPTATASTTPPPPTPTLTITPTATASPSPTATETLTPTSTLAPAGGQAGGSLPFPSQDGIKIYFVQLDTGGSVGCGDSVVAIGAGVKPTGDVAKDVEAGLAVLFANKWDFSGALYNPLYRSKIKVQHVNFDDSGLISVHLSGDYNPSGDDCDNTRVKAQIWSTIRQFRGISRTNIFLNEIPFGDRLSNDK